jgi:hypothetical protein
MRFLVWDHNGRVGGGGALLSALWHPTPWFPLFIFLMYIYATLTVYTFNVGCCIFYSILGTQCYNLEETAEHGWQILFVDDFGVYHGHFRGNDIRHIQECCLVVLLFGFVVDVISVCVLVQESNWD